MAGPAARMGDSTSHGGSITRGASKVFIGGQPAARLTDLHACPMVQGTYAHATTPISGPGCSLVLIEGLPAATMGDTTGCGASITGGHSMTIIGNNPKTVDSDSTQDKKYEFKTVVKDSDGNIIKFCEYQFTSPDGTIFEGQTNKNGEIAILDIPPGSCKLQIKGRKIENIQ